MKNKYTLIFIFLLIACGTLHAQRTFDSKKKQGNPVNTSSLNVKQIKYAGIPSKGRSGTNSSNRLSQSRNFNPSINNSHRILQRDENTLPTFIETKRDPTSSHSLARKDFRIGCADYLKELQPLLKMDHPEENFIIQRLKTDDKNITHIRLKQYYKGVPIYGAEVAVHLNASGEGEAFNGKYLNVQNEMNITPSISDHAAIERVKTDVAIGLKIRPLTTLEAILVEHAEPKSTLCIYEDKGLVHTPTLAYHIVYCPSVHARLEYFVDAHTGKVLHHFNSTCFVDGPRTASANDLNGTSRTINSYQKGSTFFMIDASRPMFNLASSTLPDDPNGGILTINLNNTFGVSQAFSHVTSTNNTWTDATAVSAHFNAGFAYEYYRTKHNRNSIDGDGGTIISIINTTDENGAAMDNAYWNGKAMFYGNGNVAFKKLAGAMDVAGHEMTHGVVQNTANLEYQGESGAINESIADIFGAMMDPSDWTIGEDVVKVAAFPSGALRSLSDPHNGGSSLNDAGYQPNNMNEKYTGSEDNGGVHVNSGITNHAFFLYAEAITRDKAAAIFYKALDDYLTKSSQFIDLRLAVIKAAGDLFGASSTEVTQAAIAFDAVGITDGNGGDYSESLPTNPGLEFLLVYSTDAADPNSLYRTIPGTSETPLSTTIFNSRPGVTDDGSAAVFVAGDNTIHVIVTDPGLTPNEFVLQDQPIWSNAVISKGGNRLAAVTTSQDKLIHVYDFIAETWASFELYNPTFSEGITSAGPLYADALEWDYTGEYLVYDAFNSLANSNGADIEYWDVNFIHVWDIATNDFSDGEVSKLFSSLPDGVSIGNPSFAKTNPNIIAFDYIDSRTGEYDILGMDIEKNDVKIIVANTALGWPSYNKNDTRVAYTSDNGATNSQTNYVSLNSDKISSNGVVIGIYDKTQWPVYFSTGDRGIGDDEVTGIPEEKKLVSLSCYPNPFVDDISLLLNQDIIGKGKVEITNLMGQRIVDFKIERSTNGALLLNVHNLLPGQYILHFHDGKTTGTCKVLKLK